MIIRAFKSISARRINVERGTIGRPFWQRGYYEHIVRNEKELLQIRRYIELNPANWRNDRENPDGVKLLPSQPWQM